ncbi:MAG: family 1 glycosylhydrolase [Patescibacteria group bacterium]|nr:family 1 glycosylhydrolase [Patescibacteria group bacterium]
MEFFFGAATASHQVEGGNHNDWTEWELENTDRLVENAERRAWPDFILRNYPNPLQKENYISGRACDHYHRFREDFDIAKSLGHNAHRFSIEWSRIEPEEGKFDEREIEHYREVLKALRERGLEPFVTVWHWTLPVWIARKGGLLAPEFPEYFARYAETLARAFAGVRFWITVNEPEVVSRRGHLTGDWPPQNKSVFSYRRSLRQLIRAHRLAYVRIKASVPGAEIGIAHKMDYFESGGGFINGFLKWFIDKTVNFNYLDRVRHELDFIGFNYYFHHRIYYGFNKNENKTISDLGWEVYPGGIYHVLLKLRDYGKPIYITENGIADAEDARRAMFIEGHLEWIRKAVKEGVDVRGYFHWSLIDNFEWSSGFWPRFGLVEINYKTLERKVRPSALAYKQIIASWRKE